MMPTSNAVTDRIQQVCEFGLLLLIRTSLKIVPLVTLSYIGKALGWIALRLGIRRSIVVENLNSTVFEKPSEDLMKGIYANLGQTCIEFLVMDKRRFRESVEIEFEESDRELSCMRNGGLIVSAHCGNWELMGSWLAAACDLKVNVVVRKQNNASVDRLINSIRMRAGMHVIYDSDSMTIVDRIRRGELVALVSDQDSGTNTHPLEFLGRSCFAPAGAAYLSRKFNLPIYVCLARRTGNLSHRFSFRKLEFERLSTEHQITVQYTRAIDSFIRTFPQSWLWHHNRWKKSDEAARLVQASGMMQGCFSEPKEQLVHQSE